MSVHRRRHAKYWAFISYNHADEVFAQWLHQAIETYRVPKALVGREHPDGEIPSRLTPVFRDREEPVGGANLGPGVRSALEDSRYLIVVSSSRAAQSKYVREEIRYFQSLGRGQRVLPVILRGQPHTDALREVVAGILDSSLDELRRREREAQRVRRFRQGAASLLTIMLTFVLYFFLCDADMNLPGGEPLRRQLDRWGWTVLRRPPSDAAIREQARSLRRELIEVIIFRRQDDFHKQDDKTDDDAPNSGSPQAPDCWTSAAITTALSTAPEFAPHCTPMLARSVAELMESNLVLTPEGERQGWSHVAGGEPSGVIGAWLTHATAAVYLRRRALLAEDAQNLQAEMQRLQSVMARYSPQDDGGWSLFSNQANADDHNAYVTMLMLDALLSAREAALSWGAYAEHDARIARTCQWLLQTLETEGGVWPSGRRSAEDREQDTFDGMTLQGYATLLRAEETSLIRLSPEFCERITRRLLDCQRRTRDYENTTAEFQTYVERNDEICSDSETVTFYWRPWAVACAARWLKRAQVAPQPPEKVIAVRRVLHHLLEELSDDAAQAMQEVSPREAAELLYGLSAIPRP